MIEIGDSLPSIIAATMAMITMSGITLFVARKSGVGDITKAASRESDRLVKAQTRRIELLEQRVAELEIERDEWRAEREDYLSRIDKLEKAIADDIIARVSVRSR